MKRNYEQGSDESRGRNTGTKYYELGYAAYEQGKYREAVEWFHEGAKQNDVDCLFCLGACYTAGDGVKQDYRKAAFYYRKAAELGDGNATFNLALCFENGDIART